MGSILTQTSCPFFATSTCLWFTSILVTIPMSTNCKVITETTMWAEESWQSQAPKLDNCCNWSEWASCKAWALGPSITLVSGSLRSVIFLTGELGVIPPHPVCLHKMAVRTKGGRSCALGHVESALSIRRVSTLPFHMTAPRVREASRHTSSESEMSLGWWGCRQRGRDPLCGPRRPCWELCCSFWGCDLTSVTVWGRQQQQHPTLLPGQRE